MVTGGEKGWSGGEGRKSLKGWEGGGGWRVDGGSIVYYYYTLLENSPFSELHHLNISPRRGGGPALAEGGSSTSTHLKPGSYSYRVLHNSTPWLNIWKY